MHDALSFALVSALVADRRHRAQCADDGRSVRDRRPQLRCGVRAPEGIALDAVGTRGPLLVSAGLALLAVALWHTERPSGPVAHPSRI